MAQIKHNKVVHIGKIRYRTAYKPQVTFGSMLHYTLVYKLLKKMMPS